MIARNTIYRCPLCGNIIEVLHAGGGTLVCCGQEMIELKEETAESSQEKHVPFIQKDGQNVLVKIGENQDHPMMEKHWIQWIEIHTTKAVYRKFLTPDDKPEASFRIQENENVLAAREYCNLHGLWKKSND